MNNSQEILDIIMQYINKSSKNSKECLIACGINTSFLTDWKTGKIKNPSYDKIVKLADYLNIDIGWLFTGKEKNQPLNSNEQELLEYYNKLPEHGRMKLIGRAAGMADVYAEQVDGSKQNAISMPCSENRVSAGTGEELYDYEQWDTVDVIETPQSRKADFMLIIDGDSMEPTFHDGDYVLVRQQPAVEVGQIGIFYVDGKGYIKKYDGDRLISLNPKYDDIPLADTESRCFGLVLGVAELA